MIAPGGAIAVWSYMHLRIDDPVVDTIFRRFSLDALGPYWPPERRLITEGYRTIPFPFDEVEAPPFELTTQWTLHDRDPVGTFEDDVRDAQPTSAVCERLALCWKRDRVRR